MYRTNPREVDCSHLSSVISVSQALAEEVPEFHRALLKTNFPSLALKLGATLRDAPAESGCVGSISTDIASLLVPASVSRAWAVKRVLPALLDSGLLELLIEDALTPGKRPFAKLSKQDPLQQICRVAHDPVVFKSLNAAERELSDALWERVVEHPIASERFQILQPAIDLHDMLEARMGTIENPVICACLEVRFPQLLFKVRFTHPISAR